MNSNNKINNSKYNLKKVNLSIAQDFWEKSPQSTFFTDPNKINILENNIDWWIVSKGDEDLCMWSVCYSKKNIVHLPPFSYYFGPIWSSSFLKYSKHSKFNLYCKIYDIYISDFIKRYKKFKFQTHFSEHDLRYFIWWKQNAKKFLIKPKYSSAIYNLKNKNVDEILSNFRELRRRMIVKAKKNKELILSDRFQINEIINLYKKTLKNKKQKVDKEIIKKIKIFCDICKNGDGKLVGFREIKKKKIVSVILLTYSKDTANLILNLSDLNWKKTGVTALNMLEALKETKQSGLDIFDFNGANSPIGADDKHSYGSEFKLYFELELKSSRIK